MTDNETKKEKSDMRNPDQVTYTAPVLVTAECEAQFDRAIDSAQNSGHWPAIVRNSRDGASIAAINATILKYRQAGWRVESGTGDTRATIWHPSCPEAHDEGGRQGYRA